MQAKPKIKVNALHVIWQSQKPAVEEQLKEILGVDELDTHHPGYFQQRNTAAKRVLDNMTEQEQAEIGRIVEDRRSQGNPDEIKREYDLLDFLFQSLPADHQNRRAERYRENHLQRWSRERWLDMGMATVIFTVHTDRQGKLVADV
jgi:predicted GNAT family N-acyltransferase